MNKPKNIILVKKQKLTPKELEMKTDLEFLKIKIFTIKLLFTPNDRCKQVHLVFTSKTPNDIYAVRSNLIILGTKYYQHAPRSVRRLSLVHEFMHSCGLRHNERSRKILKYYTKLTRDKFSREVMMKVGWQPPTMKEIAKFQEQMKTKWIEKYEARIENAKYRIYCSTCDLETFRLRKSKIIKNIDKYICPKCKKKSMKVEVLR